MQHYYKNLKNVILISKSRNETELITFLIIANSQMSVNIFL